MIVMEEVTGCGRNPHPEEKGTLKAYLPRLLDPLPEDEEPPDELRPDEPLLGALPPELLERLPLSYEPELLPLERCGGGEYEGLLLPELEPEEDPVLGVYRPVSRSRGEEVVPEVLFPLCVVLPSLVAGEVVLGVYPEEERFLLDPP